MVDTPVVADARVFFKSGRLDFDFCDKVCELVMAIPIGEWPVLLVPCQTEQLTPEEEEVEDYLLRRVLAVAEKGVFPVRVQHLPNHRTEAVTSQEDVLGALSGLVETQGELVHVPADDEMAICGWALEQRLKRLRSLDLGDEARVLKLFVLARPLKSKCPSVISAEKMNAVVDAALSWLRWTDGRGNEQKAKHWFGMALLDNKKFVFFDFGGSFGFDLKRGLTSSVRQSQHSVPPQVWVEFFDEARDILTVIRTLQETETLSEDVRQEFSDQGLELVYSEDFTLTRIDAPMTVAGLQAAIQGQMFDFSGGRSPEDGKAPFRVANLSLKPQNCQVFAHGTVASFVDLMESTELSRMRSRHRLNVILDEMKMATTVREELDLKESYDSDRVTKLSGTGETPGQAAALLPRRSTPMARAQVMNESNDYVVTRISQLEDCTERLQSELDQLRRQICELQQSRQD